MKRPNQEVLLKICKALWTECIKVRAGYKSELSGREGLQIGGAFVIQAHHLYGKSCYRLRFELDNGICITTGEHNYYAHGSRDRQDRFEDKVKKLRGERIYDHLRELKHLPTKTDLYVVKFYLEEELKKFGQR